MFGPHSPFFFLLPRSYVLTITSLKVCTTYAGYKLWELCRRYRREISQSICGNKGKKLCWNTSMYCFMNNPGSTRNCQKVIRLTVYIYYIHEPSLTSHMSWPVTERLWYLFKPNAASDVCCASCALHNTLQMAQPQRLLEIWDPLSKRGKEYLILIYNTSSQHSHKSQKVTALNGWVEKSGSIQKATSTYGTYETRLLTLQSLLEV